MNVSEADFETLLAQLRDRGGNGETSWAAAQMIGYRKEVRAIPNLLEIVDRCLQDPVGCAADRSCWGAAVALGTLKAPGSLERLRRLFRESNGGMRLYGAIALRELGDARAAPDLVAFLERREGRSHERLEAARALAAFGDVRAVRFLVELLGDADQLNVARWAAVSLGEMGQAALAALLESVKSASANVRLWAVGGLGLMPSEEALDAVRDRLHDPDPAVRAEAVALLGDRGATSEARAIEAMQDDPDEHVRLTAMSALRKLGVREGPPAPEPRPGRHIFKPYADYSQFYLGDSAFDWGVTKDLWVGDLPFERRLDYVEPGMIAIGTASYDYVQVVVDILESAPDDSAGELTQWDHVVEASLAVPTGRAAIDGCTSYLPERSQYRANRDDVSPHFDAPPGIYRVRVYYGGQKTLDEDHYRIAMWLQQPYEPPQVLKKLPLPPSH
jgi:HEAT repeat protein